MGDYLSRGIFVISILIAIVYPVLSILLAAKFDEMNTKDTRRYGVSFSIIKHRLLQIVVLCVIAVTFHDAFYEFLSWIPRGGRIEDGVFSSHRETLATFFTVVTAFPLSYVLLIFTPSMVASRDRLIDRVRLLEDSEREKELKLLKRQLEESRKRIEVLEQLNRLQGD